MANQWTLEQEKVISLRGRSLLVSAAAGSGKTTTLVERIVQKVLDEKRPVDIDRMLIVTFTKAAAADMREKICRAIEGRMDAQPENVFLQRQYTLVHNAQITTIDSFCLYVVRNYFQLVDLEPSFRIADPGELELLRAEVIDEVLEAYYEKKDEGFLRLADRYATAKSDARLVEFIQRLYDFSQSYPWPKEWLLSLADAYCLDEGEGDLDSQPWMRDFLKHIALLVSDLHRQMEAAAGLCADTDGPGMYSAAVQDDLALLKGLLGCAGYTDYERKLNSIRYTKLGVNRKYDGSPEKQERVKQLRKTMKDTLTKLSETYFFQPKEAMLSDMQKTAGDVRALAELVQTFTEEYRAKKAEKNLLDFSDIEHYALDILLDPATKEPTAAAKELRAYYDEVMIDEYQDSNYVQEAILRAVSKEADGQENIFMVGDVKQSIYRFRLARPELFLEKYKTFTQDESSRQKIDLYHNFRSRREVVDSINAVFEQIMQEDVGEVAYDSKARLNYANKDYEQAICPHGEEHFKSELLYAMADDDALEQAGAASAQELEARMTARRIKELMAGQLLFENKDGKKTLRKTDYRDIVILLRSVTGWADTFEKVLAQEGIPAHTTSKTGYFGTVEIQTILSMLSILDNPLQDIPFAAALSSPIGGFSGEELAWIKTGASGHFLYQFLQEYASFGEKEELRKKAERFLKMYARLRGMVFYTPIHKLIQAVLEETGYGSYIQAMPAGEQRAANMDLLLEKAAAYEKTSYKGLFHFVQYIERLKKYEVDYGEADITGENENVVRIMSIHKSKGLEFPIVFVCGMNKQFNRQDSKSRLALHSKYGAGMDYIDVEQRLRRPCLIKKILDHEIQMENQGEELRVLYVAMTRAKEKLILTGVVKKELRGAVSMDYFTRAGANSFLDWVYPVAADSKHFLLREILAKQLEAGQALEAAIDRLDHMQVCRLSAQADGALLQKIEEQLSWRYFFEKDTHLKTKISVSELKRQAAPEEEGFLTEQMFAQEKEKIVPAFLREEQEPENLGAKRGSAVHKILEEIDFVRIFESGSIRAALALQIEEMFAKGHITRQMKELVNPRILEIFLESPIAWRIAKAQSRGVLYKEQPFVMGIPAMEIYEGASEELVLVQGIVDVFWKEEGGIVLLDYKTDAVKNEAQLTGRYAMQLNLYAKALRKAAGEPVKEKLMYAFGLHKVVAVE